MAKKGSKKTNDDGKIKISAGMIAGIVIATVCIVCLIIALSLGSLFSKPEKEVAPIVGTWAYDGYLDFKFVFNEDGTCSYSTSTCTYKDDGSTIEILYTGNTASTTHKYRIEGNVLYYEDDFGQEVKYIKQ